MGTVKYPGQAAPVKIIVSCVRENRTHGLKGLKGVVQKHAETGWRKLVQR
jgi:hypothetical protein